MTILKHRCAFFMLFLPVSSQAGVVADLPRPGCYKTDWTARDEMRVNGELAKITTSTIDGSTGFKRVKLEIPNGDGWSKEESGTGAFYKQIQNDGSSLVSMCPATGRFDGNNVFDFTIACRNMTLDPGKLQFERIPDTAEKWEVKTNTVIRSQIGMNNAAAAQNDTIAMLEKLLANAQPRTDAERRQVAEHRAAIAALKKAIIYLANAVALWHRISIRSSMPCLFYPAPISTTKKRLSSMWKASSGPMEKPVLTVADLTA
jgi:hypothetical protein